MRFDFDIDEIDDVIHGRLRLGIMAYLTVAEAARFTELKARLKAADGNLSVQLRKLEEAGYITLERSFVARKSSTTARLTAQGRNAFAAYLATLSKVVNLNG